MAIPIKSLHKAVLVLKCFNPQEIELTGAEICQKVGWHKATVYRFLSVMYELGMLEKNKTNNKYRIGPLLFTFGNLYLSTTDILIAADTVVVELNELTNEAVSVALLDKGYVTLVMRREASSHPFRWAINQGSIFPAYASALGRALLSELADTEIDKLYPSEKLKKITPKTITSRDKLKEILKQVRKDGLALSREQSVEAVAAVIRDASGRAIAAMSIQVPVLRMNKETRQALGELVRMGSNLISYRLGYQNMENSINDVKEINLWWEKNKPE
jgi:DNA-binding IclR family transcriptional regulator